MPNWVKSIVEFDTNSKNIDEIINTIKSEEDGEIIYIDFNNIIPMPESLKNTTAGSVVDLAVDIINYKETGDDSILKEKLSYPWVTKENIKTVDEFVDFCLKNGQADLKEGYLALDNLEKYGFSNWYDWSIENWGTKWNSSESFFEDSKLYFQTAWSVPEPVLIELSKIFPKVKMKVSYADEDLGSNCGEFEILDGKVISFKEYDGISACEIWGYDPADIFPDEYRDRRIGGLLD